MQRRSSARLACQRSRKCWFCQQCARSVSGGFCLVTVIGGNPFQARISLDIVGPSTRTPHGVCIFTCRRADGIKLTPIEVELNGPGRVPDVLRLVGRRHVVVLVQVERQGPCKAINRSTDQRWRKLKDKGKTKCRSTDQRWRSNRSRLLVCAYDSVAV